LSLEGAAATISHHPPQPVLLMRPAALFLVATACTLTARAYRDINPETAAADERANNGYEALRLVEPGTAKLVLRARGAGYPAHFSVSASPQVCRDFVPSGYVAYSGRGIVLPWIARMNERTRSAVTGQQPYLVHEAKPGVPPPGAWIRLHPGRTRRARPLRPLRACCDALHSGAGPRLHRGVHLDRQCCMRSGRDGCHGAGCSGSCAYGSDRGLSRTRMSGTFLLERSV
jgi:hypothetical protein